MFKGQGANQALEDGPLLASWLGLPNLNAANVATRVRCFEREMVDRAKDKVAKSRLAAQEYHSRDALSKNYSIQGVTDELNCVMLEELKVRNINAGVDQLLQKAIELKSELNSLKLDS